MMAAALAHRDSLHGAAIQEADFPAGVVRMPVHLVVTRSSSALAYLVEARQRLGDRPDPLATVFLQEGAAFAVVDYPPGAHRSLLFAVDFSAEEIDAWRSRPSFGLRKEEP